MPRSALGNTPHKCIESSATMRGRKKCKVRRGEEKQFKPDSREKEVGKILKANTSDTRGRKRTWERKELNGRKGDPSRVPSPTGYPHGNTGGGRGGR